MTSLQVASIGDVYRIPLSEGDGITPKNNADTRNKFLVVLGSDQHNNFWGVVVVNSSINTMWANYDFQYEINAKKYPHIFTSKSYVNCASIKSIAIDRFKKLNFYGQLDNDDISSIIAKVKKCPDISKATLRKYNLL